MSSKKKTITASERLQVIGLLALAEPRRSALNHDPLPGASQLKKRKPIIVYDFDGTLSTYERGWEGAGICNDPPVPGALEHLVRSLERFHPAILSSRSHQWGGIPAMKRWLYTHLMALGGCDPQGGQFEFELPRWWADFIHAQSAMEPWWHETHSASKLVVRSVLWPIFKPPALYTIDDRAHQFDGTWPDHEAIASFKPWNKRIPTVSAQEASKADKVSDLAEKST